MSRKAFVILRLAALSAVVSLLSSPAAPLSALAPCQPHLLGADRRGWVAGVVRAGDTADVADGAALLVVDVSDPADPHTLGAAQLDRTALVLARAGPIVVAGGSTGLALVDVLDPTAPAQVGAFEFPAGWLVESVAAVRHFAFVTTEIAGLQVVDFADPASPQVVGSYPAAGAAAVARLGSHLYLAEAAGLRILDISNPVAPVSVGLLPEATGEPVVSSDGRLLLVHEVWYGGPHGDDAGAVDVYELRDPVAPLWRSRIDTLGQEDAASDGRFVLVVGTDDLDLYDLVDPGAPRWIASAPFGGVAAVGARGGRFLVAATSEGLRVLSTDPSGIAELGRLETIGSLGEGFAVGAFATAIDRSFGLRVFDLADPARPLVAGGLAGPAYRQLGRYGSFAYGWPGGGIEILDLADPTNPVPVGSFGTQYESLLVVSDRIFAAQPTRVVIYDLSTPEQPVLHGLIGPFGATELGRIAATRNTAFVWAGSPFPDHLYVYDVGAAGSTVLVGEVPDLPVRRALAAGPLLLIGQGGGGGTDGLRVLDVTDPAAIAPLGFLPTDEPPDALAARGSRAYVSAGGRLLFVDLSDPTAPVEVAAFATPGGVAEIFVGDGVVLVSDGNAGLSDFESCQPFADGFESGDASQWSATLP